MATIISKINKKKFLKWLLFIAWLLFIYYCSAKQGNQSLAMSNRIVEWVKKNFSNTTLLSYNLSFWVRKCAHLSVFFILEILVFLLLKEYKMTIQQRLFFSFCICLGCSCLDEFHQIFVAGRDGRVLDIFIDSCGSLLSLLLIVVITTWHKKHRNS